jgi:hypothetical protein
MSLISLDTIAAAAEARGFRVTRLLVGEGRGLEIFAPEHDGPTAYHHNGACYSAAEFGISDLPGIGYGYNGFFYGPWHRGFAQADAYGVQKLYAHPAMQ